MDWKGTKGTKRTKRTKRKGVRPDLGRLPPSLKLWRTNGRWRPGEGRRAMDPPLPRLRRASIVVLTRRS